MTLIFRSLFCIFRYGTHLYDMGQENNWERRNSIVYYTEMVFELLILFTDFLHHIHMLVSFG